MKKENRKAICREHNCSWRGLENEALTANNPFEPDEEIYGCPVCRGINTIVYVCDEVDCWEEVSCGTPTPEGYRSTCGEHQPNIK